MTADAIKLRRQAEALVQDVELRSYSLLTHVRLYTSFAHPDGGVSAALLDREPFKTSKTFEKPVTVPLCVVACKRRQHEVQKPRRGPSPRARASNPEAASCTSC